MKACFTSALDITMMAQMPIGRPMKQQGEMQGTIAAMAATRHRL